MTLEEVFSFLSSAKEDPSILGLNKKGRWKSDGRNGLRITSTKWRIDFDWDGIYVALIDKSVLLFLSRKDFWSLNTFRRTATIEDGNKYKFAKCKLEKTESISEILNGQFKEFAEDIEKMRK